MNPDRQGKKGKLLRRLGDVEDFLSPPLPPRAVEERKIARQSVPGRAGTKGQDECMATLSCKQRRRLIIYRGEER